MSRCIANVILNKMSSIWLLFYQSALPRACPTSSHGDHWPEISLKEEDLVKKKKKKSTTAILITHGANFDSAE